MIQEIDYSEDKYQIGYEEIIVMTKKEFEKNNRDLDKIDKELDEIIKMLNKK